ncbi:diaminopimelate decarboxylase [Candidatus Poribacteria bacterium]|nr:MAG: diaminopimelate decarboxylase [Candidatus Poribacteria bacterium]
MDRFEYRDGELYCEEVRVEDICRDVGTPVYIYSHGTIIDHYRKLDEAFGEIDHLICFSVKSNSNLAVIRALAKAGAGMDIVSGGELYRVLKAGVDPSKVVYASVGKSEEEIEFALQAGIMMFNVESRPEAEAINRVAGRMGVKARIAFRINPDVDPHTHKHITTGKGGTKFGIPIDEAVETYLWAKERLGNLIPCGVHCHIGSQITSVEPYKEALSRIVPLVSELRRNGLEIDTLNIGGGLGIVYKDETPSTADEFAAAVLPYVRDLGCKLIIEPGRFIVGNAGILATKVLYIKRTPHKNFLIVDAAMNDLIRPAFYDSYHRIAPVRIRTEETDTFDVVGPVCETGDYFAKDRRINLVEPGDIISIFSAGAYGFTMSSNYNSRPRAAEVMVIEDRYYIVRKRETYLDLIRGEAIPGELM